ncbi:MAG: RagB/SusD family nutrient uptake outer membrane protein [Muribaculaceae bacterium]|nr:RagB/SusD family nutrient uptake outer membrane protein [Muribaculaceae bacterium]
MKTNIFNRFSKSFLAAGVVLLAGCMTSCDDYLDMPSFTEVDEETVFSDIDRAESFVQGCYRGLIHSENFYQLGAGETTIHSCEDGTTNNSKYAICNYSYSPSNAFTVSTSYKEAYRIIEQCNMAIKLITKYQPESDKRNRLLAEAMTIRAYCYHNLIRIYGDVPAVWEPLVDLPDNDDKWYPTRTSRDVIYDHIIADLQQAVEWMPWRSELDQVTNERLNKQSILGVLARIALHAGGYSLRWDLETNSPSSLKVERRPDQAKVTEFYQIAEKACKQIIDRNENSLVQASGSMPAFQNLFYNHCQRNFGAIENEMMWHLAQYGTTTNSNFNIYAQTGTRGGCYVTIKAMQFALPTFYLSFDKNDQRRDVTCTSYSIYFLDKGTETDTWVDVGTTYSCIMHGKFRIPWCQEPAATQQRNLNIPMLRYADVLLMYAEANAFLHNGPTGDAVNALRQVRTRAGIGDMNIPTDYDGFFNALVQERKWELSGEFLLRTDLVRMGVLARELKATKDDMKALSKREGKYASVPEYRLYRFQRDAQVWGNPFLALDYIELTDPAEIAKIQDYPTKSSAYAAYNAMVLDIVKAHGVAVNEGDLWYPANMFDSYQSTFNGYCRRSVGFAGGYNTIQLGNIIYTHPIGFGREKNKENQFPDWIEAADGSDGLYYGFKENCAELLPFANQAQGQPMVDNPRLTQHPGYAGAGQ